MPYSSGPLMSPTHELELDSNRQDQRTAPQKSNRRHDDLCAARDASTCIARRPPWSFGSTRNSDCTNWHFETGESPTFRDCDHFVIHHVTANRKMIDGRRVELDVPGASFCNRLQNHLG